MARLFEPRIQGVNLNGDVRPGQKLFTYEAGTLTPKVSYTDTGLTVPHANPVIADSTGLFPEIFLSPESYRIILKDSTDVQFDDIDDVFGLLSPVEFNTQYELLTSVAGQTVFNTLSLDTIADTATETNLRVYVNGVLQLQGAGNGYIVTGANQITFNAGLNLSDQVIIFELDSLDYDLFTATGGQTVFTTTNVSTTADTASQSFIRVFRNGVFQLQGGGNSYTVTGANQITFTAGLLLNDQVYVARA